MSEFDEYLEPEEARPADPAQERATEELHAFFLRRRETVFYARQLEVLHEDRYLHWITNRAVRHLEEVGHIRGEWRELRTGSSIHLLWHRGFRYNREAAKRVLKLVDEYADTDIGAALGLHGRGSTS